MSRLLQQNPYDSTLFPWTWMSMDVPALFQSEIPVEDQNNTPRCDIYGTTDNHTVIDMELPGWKKENIEVRYNVDRLIVEGRFDSDAKDDGRTWKLRERSASGFRRAFRVPRGMDPSQIKTTMREGILKINLPELQAKSAPRGTTLSIEELPAGAA